LETASGTPFIGVSAMTGVERNGEAGKGRAGEAEQKSKNDAQE
jgi:hypothetical protein